MYQQKPADSNGFTLVEILVVITIVGIILPMLYLFFTNSMETMQEVSGKSAYIGSMRILLDRMRREISCSFIPSDPAFTTCFVGKRRGTEEIPEDTIHFLTYAHLWRGREHESYDMAEIGYQLMERESDRGNETYKVLVRRSDPFPDTDIEDGGDEIDMVDFITAMRIRYFDGSRWTGDWNNSLKGNLPARVRVELIPDARTGLDRTFVVVIPIILGQEQKQEGPQFNFNPLEQFLQ